MKPNEMKKIVDDYIKSYNSFDVDGMLVNMHEEVSFQNISNGQITLSTQGIAELRAAAEQAKTIFKTRRQTIKNYQFSENKVSIEIDYTGEISMDIPDGPKAGETIHLKGRSEFIFHDGVIVKLIDDS